MVILAAGAVILYLFDMGLLQKMLIEVEFSLWSTAYIAVRLTHAEDAYYYHYWLLVAQGMLMNLFNFVNISNANGSGSCLSCRRGRNRILWEYIVYILCILLISLAKICIVLSVFLS